MRAQTPTLLERNVNFGVTARPGGVHRCCDRFETQTYPRPFGGAREDNDRNLPSRKVLLVPDSPVRRDEQVKSCLLSGVQQGAVGQPVPSPGLGRDNGVKRKDSGETDRRSVIKPNEHRPAWNPAGSGRRI